MAKFGIQIQIVLAGAKEAQDGYRDVGAAAGEAAPKVAAVGAAGEEAAAGLRVTAEASIEAGEGLRVVGEAMTEMFGIALGAGAIFEAFKRGLEGAMEAATSLENAETQLGVKVRATGEGAGWTAEQMSAMAQQIVRVSTFTEPAVLGAENLLASFTNIKGANFPLALQAVADVTANTGRDMSSTAMLLGKALDAPAQAFGMLRRMGIDLDAAQKEQIKTMVEHGDIAGAQAIIFKDLAKYAGAAEAQLGTLSGQWRVLKRDTDEALGSIIKASGGFDTLKSGLMGITPYWKAGLLGMAADAEDLRGAVASVFTSVLNSIVTALEKIISVEKAGGEALVNLATSVAVSLHLPGIVISALQRAANNVGSTLTDFQTKIADIVKSGADYFSDIELKSERAALSLRAEATGAEEVGKAHKTTADETAQLTKAMEAAIDRLKLYEQGLREQIAGLTAEVAAAQAGAVSFKEMDAATKARIEVDKLAQEWQKAGLVLSKETKDRLIEEATKVGELTATRDAYVKATKEAIKVDEALGKLERDAAAAIEAEAIALEHGATAAQLFLSQSKALDAAIKLGVTDPLKLLYYLDESQAKDIADHNIKVIGEEQAKARKGFFADEKKDIEDQYAWRLQQEQQFETTLAGGLSDVFQQLEGVGQNSWSAMLDNWKKAAFKAFDDIVAKWASEQFSNIAAGFLSPGGGIAGAAADASAAEAQQRNELKAAATALTGSAEDHARAAADLAAVAPVQVGAADSSAGLQTDAMLAVKAMLGESSVALDTSATHIDIAATHLEATSASGGGGGFLGMGSGVLGSAMIGFAAFMVAKGLIDSWVASQDAKQAHNTFDTQGDIGMTGYSSTRGMINLPGQVGVENAQVNDLTAQGKQFTDAIKTFISNFETVTHSLLDKLPNISILLAQDGKNYAVSVGGKVIGFFADVASATNAAILAGLKQADFTGLAVEVKDYIAHALQTGLDSNALLANVTTIEGIMTSAANILAGAGAGIATAMQGIIDNAEKLRAAVVHMGVTGRDLVTLYADIDLAEVAGLRAQRDALTGKKETDAQVRQEEADAFNAKRAMALLQVETDETTIRGMIAMAQANAAYGNTLISTAGGGGGGIVGAAVLVAKAAVAINPALVDLQNELAALLKLQGEIEAIPILKPGDVKLPGGGGASSAASVLASAAQTLATALDNLRENGMDAAQRAADQLRIAHEAAVKAAGHNKKAVEDLNEAYAAQIKLLNEQTRQSIWTAITPLLQQAHGLSGFQISLAALDAQFAQYAKDATAAGAGTQLLAAIHAAQLQAERNLIAGIVGALSLPLDQARADAGKYAAAVAALGQGLKDGVVSLADFNAEMAQIGQQAQSTILTMIEGIYTAAGKTAEAEKVKEQLQEIDFKIRLAQLEEETKILLAQGVITQALADQVAGIEAYYADPAHQPDFAALNNPAHAAASGAAASAAQNLASALQSAIDALKKFDASLDLSAALSPLTAQQKEDSARAAFEQDLTLARAGNVQAITDLPNVEQAYLTQARAFYGSESPYTTIFNQIRQANQGIFAGGFNPANQNDPTGNLGYNPGGAAYGGSPLAPAPGNLPPGTQAAIIAFAPVVNSMNAGRDQAQKDAAAIQKRLDVLPSVVVAIDANRKQISGDTLTLAGRLDVLTGATQQDQGQLARLLSLLERRAS